MEDVSWIWDEHLAPPTYSEVRRHLEPELAFSSKFASTYAAHVLSFCAYVTAVYLFPLLVGEYSLDETIAFTFNLACLCSIHSQD